MNSKNDKCWFIIVCVLIASGQCFSQQGFIDALDRFEIGMQKAASRWIEGELSLTLDIVKKCRTQLDPAMPAPSDTFAWQGFSALKTYTLLFTRLVERELYLSKNETALSKISLKQISEWSGVLLNQSRKWYKMKASSPETANFRNRWLRRFSTVIKKSQQLNM